MVPITIIGNVLSVVNNSQHMTDRNSLTPRCFHFALTHYVNILTSVFQSEVRWHISLNAKSLVLRCVGELTEARVLASRTLELSPGLLPSPLAWGPIHLPPQPNSPFSSE